MIFYAFSENEILRLNDDIDLLEDLRAAAKYAYIERLPKREKAKSDGTMSEVLLDIIIQLASQNTKKLIARRLRIRKRLQDMMRCILQKMLKE